MIGPGSDKKEDRLWLYFCTSNITLCWSVKWLQCLYKDWVYWESICDALKLCLALITSALQARKSYRMSLNPSHPKTSKPKKACIALFSLEECRSYDCPISTSPSPGLIVCSSCKRDLFLFSFILSFWSITERIVLVSVFESHRSCVRLAAASYEVRQQGLTFTIFA